MGVCGVYPEGASKKELNADRLGDPAGGPWVWSVFIYLQNLFFRVLYK